MAFVTPIPLPSTRTRARCVTATQPQRVFKGTSRTSPRMLVIEAGSTTDMDKILDAAEENLVVVDYSTTWCGPCKKIAPAFEELSEKHTDVVFVKVMGDADSESSELMKREGIRAVPAFHFWKEKSRVHDFTGAKIEEIERLITELK